jgi:probable biosynthetic protein (TIGR04099 family)
MMTYQKTYRAGMPQLALNGLSENWLLKECGHRHWEALALDAGQALPEFIDDAGNKSYAAFTAVRIRNASLASVEENADFTIGTQLSRTGGARHFSQHTVGTAGQTIARISMASTFVRRELAHDNRSVARAAFASMERSLRAPPDEARELAQIGKQFRSGQWREHMGLLREAHAPDERRSDLPESNSLEFIPCPNNDFNGAEFLYFANFQAFVDRGEWQRHRFAKPPAVVDRDLFFHGNINVGETLTLDYVLERSEDHGLTHWCELRRGADNQKIADVVTFKRWRR